MTIPRVIALLTLLSLASAIVDRTYYTYLGLDITASADEIAQAYTSKKEKIMGIEEEESRNGKLKILEEGKKWIIIQLMKYWAMLRKEEYMID